MVTDPTNKVSVKYISLRVVLVWGYKHGGRITSEVYSGRDAGRKVHRPRRRSIST